MPNFAIYGKKKVQPRTRHLVMAACPAFVSALGTATTGFCRVKTNSPARHFRSQVTHLPIRFRITPV
jgi:hypothetical protein